MSAPRPRGTGGTGCRRRASRLSSETMTKLKLAALTTKHQPMPAVLTRTAAMVGPMTGATFTKVLFSVTALRRSPP